MASGLLHGLKDKEIGAKEIEIGLDRARTIDPIKGVGGITVLQTDAGTSISVETVFQGEPYRPGLITNAGPTGEADLAIPMYWVKLAYQPGSDPTTAISLQPSEFGQFYIIPVTNIRESAGGSKLLKTDQPVNVFIWHDLDGNYRFFIDAGAPFSLKPGKLKNAWTPGASTVTLTPCVGFSDPTPTGEGDVIAAIHIPLSPPPCFQTAVGGIMGYIQFVDTASGVTVVALWSPPLLPYPTNKEEVFANNAADASPAHVVAKWLSVHA